MTTRRMQFVTALKRVALASVLLVLLNNDVHRVTARAQDTVTITFTCCQYTPPNVFIKVGDTVTWVGGFFGFFLHPLVSDDGLWPTHFTGETFSYTFLNAGSYRFHCANHGGFGGIGMSGVVQVSGSSRVYLPFVTAAHTTIPPVP